MTRFVRVALAAVLGLGLAATAGASPITYSFSGTLDSNSTFCLICAGNDNTQLGPQFSLVIASDTAAVVNAGSGFWRVNNVNGAFTDGSFNATLTGITIVVNSNTSGGGAEGVNFFNFFFNDGLGFDNAPALAGYQLVTSVGPITKVTTDLTPTNGIGNFSTTVGNRSVHLEQNFDSSLTFTATTQAAPAAVPEPATLTLLALGLTGAAYRRRKNR